MVESPVVHEEKLKLLHVVHEELQEAVGEDVPGALVGSCTEKTKVPPHALSKALPENEKGKKETWGTNHKMVSFLWCSENTPERSPLSYVPSPVYTILNSAYFIWTKKSSTTGGLILLDNCPYVFRDRRVWDIFCSGPHDFKSRRYDAGNWTASPKTRRQVSLRPMQLNFTRNHEPDKFRKNTRTFFERLGAQQDKRANVHTAKL